MDQTIINHFEKYLKSEDCSLLTVRGYCSDIELFVRWFEQTNGGAFAVQSVTPSDVREYRQYLQVTQRRKASTVNRKLAALSALMKWAKATRQIESDPTEKIKAIRQQEHAPHYLDKKEQFALQRAIEKDLQLSKLRYPKRWVTRRRDASLTLFLLNTGLRLSELTALHLGDVQLSERKGSLLVQNGKGGKQRAVPLNTEARKALQEWLDVRPATNSNSIWVAVEAESAGLSGRAVQRILKRYAQEAGLDELTPHMCRHSFAKNLVNQDVGIEKVAALLGHANLNTTRIYITPNERDLELAVENLTNH